MDHLPGPQPTKQEMQARLREVLADMRRSVAATSEPPKLAVRAPRQTLPLAADEHPRPS